MLKKTLLVTGCFLWIVGLIGCVRVHRLIQAITPQTTLPAITLPPYSGPKARIAIADFEVKSAKASQEIGLGLREMLVATLINSNRFSLVERQQELSGDLTIAAAVTEFEPEVSGGKAGIGGGGGFNNGRWGGLLGSTSNKARLALDIRIVNIPTSEVLATMRLPAQASDVGGAIMQGSDNGKIGGSLSAYADTPMEKAIRICILEAARYISETIPANYYKY